MKRTGILLYRENLNKGKIYTRRIYNTDRKIITEGKEEWMMHFQMIEIDHVYIEKKFTVQIVQRALHL